MKYLTFILLAFALTASAQEKKAEKQYTIQFTKSQLDYVNAAANASRDSILKSKMPMSTGVPIVGFIGQIQALFNQSYAEQSKTDTTKKPKK